MDISTYDDVPFTHEPYRAAADRYRRFGYRRVGRSGLQLPPISLGLWYNFGDDRPLATQREVLRYAFDHGITHFDLANNYGPPYGAAEENFGRIMRADLHPYRDELIVSSKAGWDMWPGPYGQLGSRKYLLASLDASLRRLGLDYIDIFYSHRFDPDTPLEETIGALDAAVRQGKALYVGISSYSVQRTARRPRPSRPTWCAAGDSSARLLAAESLGRGWPDGSAGRKRHGRHCLHGPCPGAADRQVSSRRRQGASGDGSADVRHGGAHGGNAGPPAGPQRDCPPARSDPGADGAGVGAAQTRASPRPWWGRRAWRNWRRTWRRWTIPISRPRSWPTLIATPWTRGSTCGKSPRRLKNQASRSSLPSPAKRERGDGQASRCYAKA